MYHFRVSTAGQLPQLNSVGDYTEPTQLVGAVATDWRVQGATPLVQSRAHFVIFNEVGSEKIVKLQDIVFSMECSLNNSLSDAVQPYSLAFIDAYSPRNVLSVGSLDSDNVLPAGITVASCEWGPDAAPTDVFRRRIRTGSSTRAAGFFTDLASARESMLGVSSIYSVFGSTVQPIVVRPGEKLGLLCSRLWRWNTAGSMDTGTLISGVIRVNGECFTFETTALLPLPAVNITDETVLLVIDNQSGSDAVELISINAVPPPWSFATLATSTLTRMVMEPIIGVYGGDRVDVVSIDSSADPLPEGVQLLRSCNAIQATRHDPDETTAWQAGSVDERWRYLQMCQFRDRTTSTWMHDRDSKIHDYRSDMCLTLHEGEGVAFFGKKDGWETQFNSTNASWNLFPYVLTGSIRVVDNPAPSEGAAGARLVGPSGLVTPAGVA